MGLEEFEANEIGWWSYWARLEWQDKNCYLFTSKEYSEPLFNRFGFIKPFDIEVCKKIEEDLGRKGIILSYFVPDTAEFKDIHQQLGSSGYTKNDEMIVMKMKQPNLKGSSGAEVYTINHKGLNEWTRVYLQSFYDDLTLRDAVKESAKKATSDSRSRFIIARMQGLPVATTALYETDKLVGAYCVGVLPQFRMKGIARDVIRYAYNYSLDKGKTLILQNFASDSVEAFYTKLGFETVYRKDIYSKGDAAEMKSRRSFTFNYRKAATEEPELGVKINRDVEPGIHDFRKVFEDFRNVDVLKEVFGDKLTELLNDIKVVIDPRDGYMHVDDERGYIHVSLPYLRTADLRYIYLDIIHELVHVKQFMLGMELFDERYSYFKRPTEIEAYRITIKEAKRIGMTDKELIEYLRVEWVDDKEFGEFLQSQGLDFDV
ncbi:MAG: GNAT family N-acetyltransferase [Conexivisphaerales archaeon]